MNLETITVPPKLPVKTFVLTLTEEEASYLRVITGGMSEVTLGKLVKDGYDNADAKAVHKVWEFSASLFLKLADGVGLPAGIGY